VTSTRCAEVVSLAPTSRVQSESAHLSDPGTGRRLPQVKALLIAERVDGFFLQRFTDRGELVGETQHETLDEAMWQAYSEFVLCDWSFCPDDVDPLEYIQARTATRGG
jgi:hypothetical protein